MTREQQIRALAELIVGVGANVQPGQVVVLGSEPGKEPLARAVGEAAYRAGAKFVDLRVFDAHFKRARALHADADTLEFVPPWYAETVLAYGEQRCAYITLTGAVAPRIMDGVDPALLGKDMLPRVRESAQVINERKLNWTVAPCPTPDWAELVHPDLDPEAALDCLWEEVIRVCRLDESDPVAAWSTRLEQLTEISSRLDGLRLDALRFVGPGTDLTVGLLGGSRWCAARISTADGIVHTPNIPTEEVFTTPDPARVSGLVTSTKPLFVSGMLIEGLRVRFDSGTAVEIEADSGAETLRTLAKRDAGAGRLGEVALVDRESRIGQMDVVFFNTLLDENAASHIALGQALSFAVEGDEAEAAMNDSEIHIDFMIGSSDVSVSGLRRDGSEVPLLRDGRWQI